MASMYADPSPKRKFTQIPHAISAVATEWASYGTKKTSDAIATVNKEMSCFHFEIFSLL